VFCGHCGQPTPDNAPFCTACGKPTPPSPSPYAPALGVPETSGQAIASLVFGLFGFFFPAAITAVVLGHISRSSIRASAGRLKGEGMALAGLILGYMGVAFIPIILIIAAIAIPNLLRSRIAANEASAIGSIRTINTAERAYASSYPSNGYACHLSQLGTGSSSIGPENAGLIDQRLASGTKRGYRFAMYCGAVGIPDYTIIAYPITPNQTGSRVFCSDSSGVIRYKPNNVAGSCGQSSLPL